MESIDGWLMSSKTARYTGLATAGSKAVVLSWDTPQGTLSLAEVDESNAAATPIFTKSLADIKLVTFLPGRYFIVTNDEEYLITTRSQSKTATDVTSIIDQGTGSIVSTVQDAKSNIDSLQKMLGNKAVVRRSKGSRLEVTIILIVIAFTVLVVGLVLSIMKGETSP